jgi:hypothetical protein
MGSNNTTWFEVQREQHIAYASEIVQQCSVRALCLLIIIGARPIAVIDVGNTVIVAGKGIRLG